MKFDHTHLIIYCQRYLFSEQKCDIIKLINYIVYQLDSNSTLINCDHHLTTF